MKQSKKNVRAVRRRRVARARRASDLPAVLICGGLGYAIARIGAAIARS